jgi:hypothetical protein
LFYHYQKNKRDGLVVGLLFFFTGFAIVVYLNMPGNQPRERDYAFVGSFYAFAIWIGIGVLYVKELLQKVMSANVGNYVAAGICTLAVPVLMASQEWDDHDRGKKVLARDLAIDYLESCAPNAILVSFGDNDTYPLWYAQEVEGIRRDVRVINSSLLGTDAYINQLRYKINQSDPIDPIWTADQIEGAKRDYIYYAPKAGIDPNVYMDLYTMMKDYAGSDDPAKVEQARDGSTLNVFPTRKVKVPVDINMVKANGTVNANDSVVSEVKFDIPARSGLQKGETAILNIIAANKWRRPIYFTNEYNELGFGSYLRQDGLTYRLVPVVNKEVNDNWVYDKMMGKFVFGNANVKGVYFDEENRRHLNSIRLAYAKAAGNLAENGKKDEAKKMLEKCDAGMLEENMSYGMVSRYQQHDYVSYQFLDACYKAGDTALAEKVTRSLKKDLEQQMTYYNSLNENRLGQFDQERGDMPIAANLLKGLQQMEQFYKNPKQLEVPATITNNVAPAKKPDSAKK